MSNILTDLRAALEAKLETEAEHPSTATSWHMDVAKADETLHTLLTDDTIRALLDVAGLYDDAVCEYVSLKAERDALLAEHEAVAEYGASLRDSACKTQRRKMLAAHDNAERVIRGE